MNYQKLFNYMSEEHGVVLLEQDMQEIRNIVNEMQSDELRQEPVSGECEHPYASIIGDGEMKPARCLKCGKYL